MLRHHVIRARDDGATLTPRPRLTPHPSRLTPHASHRAAHPAARTPQRAPRSAQRAPHPAHPAPRTPSSSPLHQGLILNNYATADSLAFLARVGIGASIIFSFPLNFVGLREGVLGMLGLKEQANKPSVHWITTIALMCVTNGVALVLKDLGLIVALGGAILGSRRSSTSSPPSWPSTRRAAPRAASRRSSTFSSRASAFSSPAWARRCASPKREAAAARGSQEALTVRGKHPRGEPPKASTARFEGTDGCVGADASVVAWMPTHLSSRGWLNGFGRQWGAPGYIGFVYLSTPGHTANDSGVRKSLPVLQLSIFLGIPKVCCVLFIGVQVVHSKQVV